MKIIRNILIIALALLLQSTLFGRYSIWGIKPDLAMLMLIVLVNNSGPVEIVLYGFLIGFIQDVYTPEFLGINAFTMSLMGFTMDFIKDTLTVENYFVKAFVTFGACVVHDFIYLSLYTKFNYYMVMNFLFKESLLGAVYTSVLLLIFVIIWEWMISGGFHFVIYGFFGHRR